ncbi:HugZ family pyridoxamine 5'-phosphate oxidase [Spartinivicinus ruber]|uniref:HugZ family pyridoxamine 5'-phosphate oxidase n=1 Tax=Spartinivicinus ruber TaxID=2683272 RepID=UPI0013D2F227|nr:DUF2470 domain-containing protein [Spartinivicinus ruber]
MSKKEQAAKAARQLLLNQYHGVLATQSLSLPGYPFGSVVPYCLDGKGHLVMLISRIAQHTKNIEADNKVSLTVTEADIDDIQTGARLTWVGDAYQVNDPLLAERYYAFFPQARGYHQTHDFDFYVIELVRARFIGGFGEIYWLEPELLIKSNPFFGEVEQGMVQHMNQDHTKAMETYCQKADIKLPEGITPQMAGIDSEGFNLRITDKIVRIPFAETVDTPQQVRQQLVALAH